MSNYKKVVLTEKQKNITSTDTIVKKQLNKFDNNYTSQKLNDLYDEFDAINFENASATIVKNNAVDVQVNSTLKTAVILSTSIIVAILMIFLAIYNIFVINNLHGNIKLLEKEVGQTSIELSQLQEEIANLSDEEIKQLIHDKFGGEFKEITNDSIRYIKGIKLKDNFKSYKSTNWFDKLCSFFSDLFGG